MTFVTMLSAIGSYLLECLKLFGHTIVIAPFKNPDMLWVLIPIYIGWLFAEFFQEKRGTSLGNAISNAVIVLWGGIDWLRTTVNGLIAGTKATWTQILGKFAIAGVVIFYGIFIILGGAKGKPFTKHIGRIREVTYVVVVFTPVFYGVTKLSLQFFITVLLFFPIIYYLIELVDYLIPDPQSIKEEESQRPWDSWGKA